MGRNLIGIHGLIVIPWRCLAHLLRRHRHVSLRRMLTHKSWRWLLSRIDNWHHHLERITIWRHHLRIHIATRMCHLHLWIHSKIRILAWNSKSNWRLILLHWQSLIEVLTLINCWLNTMLLHCRCKAIRIRKIY